MISKDFKTISIIRRRIKDGYVYEDFRHHWLPEAQQQYHIPTYVINALKVGNPQEVISIGLIASDMDGVTREGERVKNLHTQRRNQIIEVADSHGNVELYTIQNIDKLYNYSPDCFIRPMTSEDILRISELFKKDENIFKHYLKEQKNEERLIWVACIEQEIAGYITLSWHSLYPSFRDHNIPEIMDLNVLPSFRKQGIGAKLLETAEQEALQKSDTVGIGVGLYGGENGGYGSAQRLYIKHGYIPDGKGVSYNYEPVKPWSTHRVDDDLILWFVKKLG